MTTREDIRSLPTPTFTLDDLFHIGTVLDQHGRVTVTFKRGPVVRKVQMRAVEFANGALDLANEALKAANR
jgi:hypothetical protein